MGRYEDLLPYEYIIPRRLLVHPHLITTAIFFFEIVRRLSAEQRPQQ